MFWFVDPEACGILAPRSGIEPAPPALEGKVLTIGLPGKFQDVQFQKLTLAAECQAEAVTGDWVRGFESSQRSCCSKTG